jgi:hypothetical protein
MSEVPQDVPGRLRKLLELEQDWSSYSQALRELKHLPYLELCSSRESPTRLVRTKLTKIVPTRESFLETKIYYLHRKLPIGPKPLEARAWAALETFRHKKWKLTRDSRIRIRSPSQAPTIGLSFTLPEHLLRSKRHNILRYGLASGRPLRKVRRPKYRFKLPKTAKDPRKDKDLSQWLLDYPNLPIVSRTSIQKVPQVRPSSPIDPNILNRGRHMAIAANALEFILPELEELIGMNYLGEAFRQHLVVRLSSIIRCSNQVKHSPVLIGRVYELEASARNALGLSKVKRICRTKIWKQRKNPKRPLKKSTRH